MIKEFKIERKFIQSLFYVFLFCSISFPSKAQIDIQVNSQQAVISNQKIKKIIRFSDKNPASIQVVSLFDRIQEQELLTNKQQSWFEFVVNDNLLKSGSDLWKYQNYNIRELRNGGKELTLVFSGASAGIEGLGIVIKQQVFPGSRLIREQLTLTAPSEKGYYLRKQKGELHFIFPQYNLKTGNGAQLTSTEFRIASWGKEILDQFGSSSYDSRKWDDAGDMNLAMAHMFHPDIKTRELSLGSELHMKGPFAITSFLEGQEHFLMAYEHASQDTLIDFDSTKTNGVVPPTQFLALYQQRSKKGLSVSLNMLRGGYLDGQHVNSAHPYESVWTASGFYCGKGLAKGKDMIHDYLLHWIVEDSVSREPAFYYNTWAMQRDEAGEGKDIRGVMTTDRILKELTYADELGVDIFVLDDGWQQKYGIWRADNHRLKKGLEPIYEAAKKRDIKLGLWLSPLGINKETQFYQQHRDWLIRNREGDPVGGQGNHPVFCLMSGFYDQFIQESKKLIDQGVRFFKWDGINTFACTSALHQHGDEQYTKEERAENYAYLLPLYIKKAMAELTAYEPDLVIEIDLTENSRSQIGLAPMSEGKVFWMNNGASWYGDYSFYRAKSMRMVPNEFVGLLPFDLLTYANYPQNKSPYFSQRYNVNSSLIAGRGFWGDLSEMNEQQRERVGRIVAKSKNVLPHIRDVTTKVTGRVGASPEIYERVNAKLAAGQVIAFSGSALNYNYKVKLDKRNLLAVVNNSYRFERDSLLLEFQFPMADASREAFLYPNQGSGISIIRSTSWLEDVELKNNRLLNYTAGAAGSQDIIWPKQLGKPAIKSIKESDVQWLEKEDHYKITVTTQKAGQKVTLDSKSDK